MRNKFLPVGIEAMIQGPDSEEQNVTGKECLPGGFLTVVLGKARALLKEEIARGPLEN